MPNKKTALIAALVCAASLLFLSGLWLSIMMRRNDAALESIIYLYLFSFLLFFYFFPGIRTIERSLIYCVLIPFFCCTITSISYIIAPCIGGDWRLFTKDVDGIFDLVRGIIIIIFSGAVLYFIFGWIVSISLMFVCAFHLWLQKANKQDSAKLPLLYFPLFRENLINLKWFKCNRFAFVTGLIYIVFMSFYYFIFRDKWAVPDKWITAQKIFPDAVYICLPSLFSIFYLTPAIFKKMKKFAAYCALLFCCMLLPLFWSVLIRSVHAALIYSYLRNTKFFREEILSVDFYLHRYLETRAWFISLLLVFVCVIYYYFLKGETAKKVQENVR